MKITQVELLSADLFETEEFYSNILGLQIHDKSASLISFDVGYSKLQFKKTDFHKPIYHLAFNIPCNKLQEAEQWLSSRISLIKYQDRSIVDFKNWNAKSVYFFDNNENVLEFIARFSLDNKSDKPFDGSGILSISEIALVVEDVQEFATKLIRENGLLYFDKQIQSESFSVIGEDDGLLILSGLERNWFPTDIKAEKFPMKVLVESRNKTIGIEYN